MEIKLIRNGKEVKFDSLEDFDRVTKELLKKLEAEKNKYRKKAPAVEGKKVPPEKSRLKTGQAGQEGKVKDERV